MPNRACRKGIRTETPATKEGQDGSSPRCLSGNFYTTPNALDVQNHDKEKQQTCTKLLSDEFYPSLLSRLRYARFTVRIPQTEAYVRQMDGRFIQQLNPLTVPPKVEYQLTDIGRSLVPLITQLTEWAQTNIKKIVEHRKEFEAGDKENRT